jgi:protein-S-isoprenylcysteine O-methyltransferase Ste14
MPGYGYIVLAVGWAVWVLPFFLAQRKKQSASVVDHRARWGMFIQGVAYALLWQGKFWLTPPAGWRFVTGILFLVLASMLSWSGARALGRQWRMDAGLNADHQLVRSGPYRFVRHPIYASMFCTLLGTGFLITPKWLLVSAIVVFVAGTEIRVRVEERLLAPHFGGQFLDFKRTVAAYIPFVR